MRGVTSHQTRVNRPRASVVKVNAAKENVAVKMHHNRARIPRVSAVKANVAVRRLQTTAKVPRANVVAIASRNKS